MASIALKRGGSFSSASGSSDCGSQRDLGTRNLNGGTRSFLGGGGPPLRGNIPVAGLYGPNLAALAYQDPSTLASLSYQEPYGRRHSFAHQESSSSMADDLSLLGECDVSSIRSDKQRPGRRASLSAAIELTRSPPPKKSPARPTNGGRAFRRNSLFGNNKEGKDKEASAESPLPKFSAKKPGSRRASMTGYPAAEATLEEPEPTPQFFHSRKKEKSSRKLKKSTSFDKDDTRAEQIKSGSKIAKIKRPGAKGSRRASMSAVVPGRLGLTKSSNISLGSNRSIAESSVGNSSSYEDDISDDDDYYGLNHKKGNDSAASLRRTATAPTPPRSSSYGSARNKKELKKAELELDDDDLGYGDPEGYDPQLPPPPPPGANKQKVFVSRRGSTGTNVSTFHSNTAAQRSLKESLQWKAASAGGVFQSLNSQRRGSTASSVANSVATDVVTNTQGARRMPADVPPPPSRGPEDLPPGAKRVPADIAPPPGRRVPLDVPPPPATPQQGDKPRISARLGGGTPMGDDSENSFDNRNSSSHPTPVQSNRRTVGRFSTIGNSSFSLGSMNDESESSQEDAGFSLLGGRRASRGLSVLQKKKGAPEAAASKHSSSLLVVSSLGGSFNPYGTGRNRDSDDEDEGNNVGDDDDDAETEEEQAQNRRMADFGSEAGDHTEMPTTEKSFAAPTVETMTSTGGSSSMNLEVNEMDDKKDDDSVGSMESEAPQEKAPELDVDESCGGKKQTAANDLLLEIGATGDWSGGAQDHLTTKSLLDRYPGSDYGAETHDLGYGKVLNAYDDESERRDDHDVDEVYGLSDLYDEDYASSGWRESRPRAADSIEFINMEQLMSKAKNTKGLYLPTFIPAHGCTNASDFIVRCFVARLRAGVTVTKHSRSRFVKSHDRILHILPTGYHITWIPETEDEEVQASRKVKKPPTKLDLTKCQEVRHAWSRDPKSSRYTGTSTLRSKCKEGTANRSFALIYPKRTIDFTAMTVDQCKVLMEGFSALCFRLQMARLEQQLGDDDTQNTGISGHDHDNDSTTASLTGTNLSAPWGL